MHTAQTLHGSRPTGEYELRDYQYDSVTALLNPPPDVNRSLAVLATGGGKTIIFSMILDLFLKPGERGLVVAHRDELIKQACDKIGRAAPCLHIEVEQSALRASRYKGSNDVRSVVVGSVQSLKKRRLEEWDPDAFNIIIIDEAHHATADTYFKICERFGCFDDARKTRLIGVTATPKRTDGIGLGAIFQEITVEYGIRTLIKKKWLVDIRAHLISTGTDLRNVSVRAGDYAAGELEETVNTEDRNIAIVGAYEQYAAGKQAVAFCAGVQHCKDLAEYFNARGIPTEPVWGNMPMEDRERALRLYAEKSVMVLTNNLILTEGWDSPQTECIIAARPTKSELLLTQMIGRGTRLHEGKDHLLVLDVADVCSGKNLASVATLAGLPLDFEPKGGKVYAMAEALEEIDPRLLHLINDRDSLEKVFRKVRARMSVVEIDLFSVLTHDESTRAFSALNWLSIGEDRWRISVDKGHTYEIRVNTLSMWEVVHMQSQGVVYTTRTKEHAFRYADNIIERNFQGRMGYLKANARWRTELASDKQKNLIKQLSKCETLPDDLKKGDAAIILTELFGSKGSKRRKIA